MHVRRTYFSVPFRMDIMAFWVNQELLDQAGLDRLSCLSDLEILQKKLQNTGKYAYGDAWEISYIYNSISEYVDFSEEIIQTGRIRKQEKRQNI